MQSASEVNGSIHYANLSTSPRLKKLHNYLSDGKEHTTADIIQNTYLCAVNSAVCELRKNDIPVTCRQLGKGIYTYQLGTV